MSTKKNKPKKARKGKGSKKGSRRSKKGLSGTSSNAAKAMNMKQALVETGKQGGGTALGLLTSAAIGYGLDKIPFMQPKEGDGKMATVLKKAAKPVLILAIGTTTSVIARKKGSKFAAAIGDGVIAGGVFSTVKAVVGSKTQIFNGLGAAGDENSAAAANYYKENLDALEKVMKENGKVVELRGLGQEVEDANLSDQVIIPGTQINYGNSSAIV